MFTKLNQYLLTHHPLLWNTRIIQFLIVNLLFHLLFFFAGYVSVNAADLQSYYRITSVGDGGLFFFSILLSIVVVITWLVFFLRNNAFKQFYILSRFHLIKEFLLITLLLFSSITYYESYFNGVMTQAKRITDQATLVREANILNLAKAFIPQNKGEYFIGNACNDRTNTDYVQYQADVDYTDSININQTDSNTVRIRRALAKPDAFSYRHYCQTTVNLEGMPGFDTSQQIREKVKRLLDGRQKDSIKAILEEALAISKKYSVNQYINTDELAGLPFLNPGNTISKLYDDYERGGSTNNASPYYFSSYPVRGALTFLQSCYDPAQTERWAFLLAELYTVLGIGIILLCYRRFSKKVFLISLIGGIVWFLFFCLVGVTSQGIATPGYLFIFLFFLFTLMAVVLTRGNKGKTMAGLMQCWHIVMAPALLMVIAGLIAWHKSNAYSLEQLISTEEWCRIHPVYCWIDNNIVLISWVNLGLSFLYVLFIFNAMTKAWQVMADE